MPEKTLLFQTPVVAALKKAWGAASQDMPDEEAETVLLSALSQAVAMSGTVLARTGIAEARLFVPNPTACAFEETALHYLGLSGLTTGPFLAELQDTLAKSIPEQLETVGEGGLRSDGSAVWLAKRKRPDYPPLLRKSGHPFKQAKAL